MYVCIYVYILHMYVYIHIHYTNTDGERSQGMSVLRHARLLAECLSLQTLPQAHYQRAIEHATIYGH
jgi:hypothetical protein